MNGDRDGFSPPRAQELGPMSGTIYNSETNDTLRTLFCQEAPLAIVVVRSGRSPPRNATASLSFRYHSIFCSLLGNLPLVHHFLSLPPNKGMKALTKMNIIGYYRIVKRCRERLPKWM